MKLFLEQRLLQEMVRYCLVPSRLVCSIQTMFLYLELPFGWEECSDSVLGLYYIDHNTGIAFYLKPLVES